MEKNRQDIKEYRKNNENSKNEKKITGNLKEDMSYLNEKLQVDKNFDIVYRVIQIGGKEACFYFVDGFCKDELMQKLLQYFLDIKAEEMPKDAHEMSKGFIPYVEVDLSDDYSRITHNLLSGVFVMLIDGYTQAILLDSRTYPARSVGFV